MNTETKIQLLVVSHCTSWLRMFCAYKINNAGYTWRGWIILPVINVDEQNYVILHDYKR